MRSGLQRRVMFSLGILSLLLLIVAATALLTVRYAVNVGLRDAHHEEEVSQLANEVAVSALLSRRYEKDFLLSLEHPVERARALRAWRTSNERIERAIDAFSAAATGAEDMRQIELWRAAYRFFLDGFQQATASVESGRAQSTADALRLFQPVGENLTTLTDMALMTSELKRGAADGALVRLKELTRRVMLALGAVGAAALVSAAAWSIFFPGRLLRPILLLHEAATRLSEGELSARADVRSSDELGDLAARFNRMAETIEQRTGELEAQTRRAEAARDDAEAANAKISDQLSTIKAQRTLIGSLSVPILPLNETTLVVPLVGELDSDRLAFAEERLLQAIERSAAGFLILDITAVPIVDTKVADGLVRLVRAVELLGAEAVLVGIRPEVARSLVELGIDLGQIATQRSLQSGIAHTVRRQR